MYHLRQTALSPTNVKIEETATSSTNYPTETVYLSKSLPEFATETVYLTTPTPKYQTEIVYLPQPLSEPSAVPALPPVSGPNDQTKQVVTDLNLSKKHTKQRLSKKISSSRLNASIVSAPESTEFIPAMVYANRNRNKKSRNRGAAVLIPTICPCVAKVAAGILIGLLLIAAIVVPIILTSQTATTTTTTTTTTTSVTTTTTTSTTTTETTTTSETTTTITSTSSTSSTSTSSSTTTSSSTATTSTVTTTTSSATTSTETTSTATTSTSSTSTTSSSSTSTSSTSSTSTTRTSSTSTSSTSSSSTSTTTTTTTATLSVPLTTSGVQKNFDPASLPTGWILCYNDTYDVVLNSTLLQTIFTQCNRGKLLLGCGLVNSTVLTLAAMGLRSDVLFNCSNIVNCTNVGNGVGWYYSSDYSWGFAPGTDSVYRSACDTDISTQGTIDPDYRLCWHTGPTSGGYRCGTNIGLNSDRTFMRVIYTVD